MISWFAGFKKMKIIENTYKTRARKSYANNLKTNLENKAKKGANIYEKSIKKSMRKKDGFWKRQGPKRTIAAWPGGTLSQQD